MQQLQHTHFTSLLTGWQMRNEQSLFPIGYYNVQLSEGAAAIGNKSNDDKIRPWFRRQEA